MGKFGKKSICSYIFLSYKVPIKISTVKAYKNLCFGNHKS